VTVDVDLGAGFKVESKAARSGAGEVGVMWQKDY
jgi:autotransporter translocation and assembly factor TamB